jgi:hypothetical protein
MNYDEAMKSCIFRFISGSHAYGTNRPDSDHDFRGVFIAPLANAFDLFQTSFTGAGTIGQKLKTALDDIEDGKYDAAAENIRVAMQPDNGDLNLSVGTVHKTGEDEELQELRKFMKLASDSNPNIIEFLYVDRLITHETAVWRRIRENRHLFLSKKARWTFSGYAHAQLDRIKTHRGYLLNPPAKKPTRADFGLPESTVIAKEHHNALLSLPSEWVKDEERDYVKNEKAFQKALAQWNSYQKWEKERNPARKELERKFGYDVKHAAHLVRLSRMGTEILAEGTVKVYRPDREELQGILRGEWPYEKLVEHAEQIDSSLDGLYEKSALRDRPDHKGISQLYKAICEEHYKIKIG